MKTLLQLLIIAAFSGFAQNKKVVFLADRGKNSTTHAHESGNELLANALEKSELGFETSLQVGQLILRRLMVLTVWSSFVMEVRGIW